MILKRYSEVKAITIITIHRMNPAPFLNAKRVAMYEPTSVPTECKSPYCQLMLPCCIKTNIATIV